MEILAFLGISSIFELITYLVIIACGVIFLINKNTLFFKDKYSALLVIAKIAVGAAEQLAKKYEWDGPNKYKYVYDMLSKYAKNIPEEEIQAIIEDAVLHINSLPESTKIIIENIISKGGLESFLNKMIGKQ